MAALALWWAGLVGVAGAAAITEFLLPTGSGALSITTGPDGALWFTDFTANKIWRITTTGAITGFAIPTPASYPDSITAGPDGALWFTEYGASKIGRTTINGNITEFALPTADWPSSITAGPDGALWFTSPNGNKIGRTTTTGAITEFALPIAGSYPYGITAGPDGALWFTELNGNKIGRISTNGIITEFPLPTPNSYPHRITAGPDGAIWFTEYGGNKIGRITTTGAITEFPLPTEGSSLRDITIGPDGALWFTAGSKIGRITTDGIITELPHSATDITQGPDGALWFTDGYRVWRLNAGFAATVAVSLNESVFRVGQTMTSQATLTPGSIPTPVDIYLGALLPDGVTFLSLLQVSPGVISASPGPSPIPFVANVPVTQAVVPFSHTFTGTELLGTYLMYAALVVPGSNPLLPENQLSAAVQPFQFSSDVCLSVSVSSGGWETINPPGTYGGPTCGRAYAPGTAVTVSVHANYEWFVTDYFVGWGGDCAEVGTIDSPKHGTCTLVMTTSKSVSASFYCPFCGFY